MIDDSSVRLRNLCRTMIDNNFPSYDRTFNIKNNIGRFPVEKMVATRDIMILYAPDTIEVTMCLTKASIMRFRSFVLCAQLTVTFSSVECTLMFVL